MTYDSGAFSISPTYFPHVEVSDNATAEDHMSAPVPAQHIESFTWTNLHADIYFGLNSNAVSLYLDSVVLPALERLDLEIDMVFEYGNPGAEFLAHDLKAVRASTIQAFVLSIQSLWERQFRRYLIGCRRELGGGGIDALERDDWGKLIKAFEKMRRLPLQAFDSFPHLDLLQVLGNACRHGDGKAARRLFELRPDLWPEPLALFPGVPPVVEPPSFAHVVLTRALLVNVARAVIWFWEDHHYIYTNSISNKHESVAKSLAEMRAQRAARSWEQ